MTKRYLLCGLIALVVLGLIVFEAYNRPNRAIRASLVEVARAIDDGNWESFSQYANIDSVSSSLAKAVLDRLRREVAQEGVSSLMQLERILEHDKAESSHALQLQLELREFVEKAMLDSLRIWAQAPLQPFTVGPWIEPSLLDRLELGHAVFEGVTAIERNGRSATATLAVRYDVLDTTFTLPIGLSKQGKVWRVVDVSGLDKLADAIDARKDRIVQRANAEIIGNDWDVFISNAPTPYLISNAVGSGPFMGRFERAVVHFSVGNYGDKPIKNLRFKLFVKQFPRNYVIVEYNNVIQPNDFVLVRYSDAYMPQSLLHRVIKAKNADALAIQLIGFTIVDGNQEIERQGFESWEIMNYMKLKEAES